MTAATVVTTHPPSMVIKVKVDGQGRMVLPKWLRQELGAGC